MVDVEQFLASGRIEEYCLGLLSAAETEEVLQLSFLYPTVRQAIESAQKTLEDYAADNALPPRPTLKSRVMLSLGRLGEPAAFDLNQLPLLNAYSDAEQWQRTVAAIEPTRPFNNLYSHTLQDSDRVTQFLVWVRREIRPEDHHEERESFLILEGDCECRLGNETVRLSAGDFLEIPLDTEHRLTVLSEIPVKAVIQRLKAA